MAKGKLSNEPPTWIALRDALNTFARCEHGTQGQKHITPLHSYVACRLVVEGGFHPDAILPRPPFMVRQSKGEMLLQHDPAAAVAGEHTVFGGLKTKAIDVVVSLPAIGPVVAVSMKGTLSAFRNLTNRMEEAAGDCTNVHLAYPGLVYAFWNVLRGNTDGRAPRNTPSMIKLVDGHFKKPDVAILQSGSLSSYVARFIFAMERLSGRRDLRDEPSSYEAVGVTLVDVSDGCCGQPVAAHPPKGSPLHYNTMFENIYRQYDLRFVYQSPQLRPQTARLIWSEESPAIKAANDLDYAPRVGDPETEEDVADEMEDESES